MFSAEKYDVVCPNGDVLKGKIRPKPIKGTCKECSKDFYWDIQKRGKGNPKLFCNKSCSASYRNRRMAGVPRRKIYPPVQANCGNCGEEFTAKWAKGTYRKFCCHHCAVTSEKPRTVIDEAGFEWVGHVKANWSPFRQTNCKVCGKLTTQQRWSQGGSRYCSPECAKKGHRENGRASKRRIPSNLHVQRAKRAGVELDRSVSLEAVARRDNMTCQICGCKVHKHKGPQHGWQPKAWSIDHIIPLNPKHKGPHTWDNVQLACIECNTEKGDSLDESYNQ